MSFGIEGADEGPAQAIKSLRQRLGYACNASVRKLKRNPDKATNGTGERSPIGRYEVLMHYFKCRNLAALFLMRERFHYVYGVIMNEPLAQDEKPFSAIDAATELTQLTAELNAAAVRGENTAPILARIEAAAYLQHRRLTNSKIKETLAPAKPAAPVNWKQGHAGLARLR